MYCNEGYQELSHRYNASQLEDWCRGRGVVAEGVASQLAPIIQASKLLQMKKSTVADVDAICDLCTQLNALQVQKILTMYTPSDQFEERVPAAVIQQVAKMGGANGVDPNLIMIDATRCVRDRHASQSRRGHTMFGGRGKVGCVQ